MKKFRKYIYCNNEMLKEFINQIPDLSSRIKEIEKQKISTVEGKGGIGIASIDSKITENTKTVSESIFSDIELFISWCENKNNSININEKEPNIDDKGVICIVYGKAYLPHMVQDFELLESFKENLELMSTIDGVKQEDIRQTKLLKSSSCIPILLDCVNDFIINCSILKKNLKESIDDFFDSIDDEIVIIGRIDKIYLDGQIEIFDIAKECLKINRTVRRKMTSEQLKNVVVYEEAPLLKITPLIIYK